jgi:zinc protease
MNLPCMTRRCLVPLTALLWLHLAPTAAAQQFAHPTALAMPAPRDPRPDPAAQRLTLEHDVVAYIVADTTVPLVTVSAFLPVGRASGPEGATEAFAAALRQHGPRGLAGSWHDYLRERNTILRVEVQAEWMEVALDAPAARGAESVALLARLLREPVLDASTPTQLLSAVTRRAPAAGASGASGPMLYEGSLDEAVRLFNDRLLAGTPYAPSVSPAAAQALASEALQAFQQGVLAREPITLAVAGDFTRRAAESWVREAFPSGYRQGVAAAAVNRYTAGSAGSAWPPRSGLLLPAPALQAWIVLGHELPPVPAGDEAALLVMNYILGGGHFDARLFIEVRDKRGLANTAAAVPVYHRAGPGSYTFRTYGRPESVALLVRILQDEIRRIQAEPVSAEALQVAQGAYTEGEYGMWYHDGESSARSLALEWLQFGNHERSAGFRQQIQAVTLADVQRVARAYLQPDALRLLLLGPLAAIEQAEPMEGAPPLSAFGALTVVE